MKINYEGLVADLVQSLLDYGMDAKDILYTLKLYGISKKDAKEWYGLDESNGGY